MAQYINKDKVVAEIESKFQKYWKMGEDSDALQDGNAMYWGCVLSCINEVKTLIDTLEVKEVDLEKELKNLIEKEKAFVTDKACRAIEKLLSGYIIRNFNFGDSYDIDRLIEDFKNYMKGE